MKKKRLIKKILSIFASLVLVFSSMGFVNALESSSYKPGYEISVNEDFPNSDAHYQVRFTYQTDEDLDRVQLTGGFAFYTEEAAKEYLDNGSTGTIDPVAPENFKNGMFTTGHLVSPGGYVTIDMKEVTDGVWSVDIPLPNGQYYYRYNLYSNGSSDYNQITDPANEPFANGNNSSGWSLLYVGDATDTFSNQEFIFPRESQKGTVQYNNYREIDGNNLAIGVYLPYNYDESKEYKTLYLSHGSGGNEVEWMEIGSAKNIMDNLIAGGYVEDTIVVTLDLTTYFRLGNSAPGNGFEEIEDNIINYVIPYVESHYSVSKNASDRAFAGLSGGARLATFLYQRNAGYFGYFGMFSHTLAGIDVENIENNDYPTLMLGYGNLDPFGKQNFPDFTSHLDQAGIDYDLYEVLGGHDWGAWRELLTIFVKDYLWSDDSKPANPGDPVPSVPSYQPGVTVYQDDNSPSGYIAHFGYDVRADQRTGIPADATIDRVQVVGSFRLLSGNASMSEESDHGLDEYQNGDFCANVHPYPRESGQSGIVGGEWPFEMTTTGEDKYVLEIPMISGAHYYYYQIDYTNADGTTGSVQIDDPANPSPCRENEGNSNSSTGDITHSIVFGKWDSVKQSQSPNLDFVNPYEGENKGTLEYVEYQGSLAEDQDLGIYLPAGYDPNREEPYKVIYLSHGAGGNETYWFSQPQATNIMDHVITENPDQEAIVVGMDNTLYGWNYEQIGDNVVNYIIPFMEANYNVSHDADDRAFAGFSMGAMTTTYMAFHHADAFGYFGIFSGCNIGNATFKDGFEYDSSRFYDEDAAEYLQEVYENIEASDDLLNSVVFTMAGDADTALFANGFGYYGAYETIRDWCDIYMPDENFIDGGLVHGSHDIYTWGQCLYTFAKDICWSKDTTSQTPDVPDKPVDPNQPDNGQAGIVDTTKPVTSDPGHSVATGDNASYPQYLAIAVVALAGVVLTVKKNRKFTLLKHNK